MSYVLVQCDDVNELMLLGRLILAPIILMVLAIIIGLVYKGIDRKLAAHMQGRIGPPIRQPFRDVRKLLIKENIVPENAVPWLFDLAPLVALASAVTILLYLPIANFKPILSGYGDLILILYLLMLPALALVIGGFASGSPYATVGAQREMVMMMAYEFPLAIVVISIAWKLAYVHPDLNAFSLVAITTFPVWQLTNSVLGYIGFLVLLVALFAATPGELAKIPFDAPEAETEIAGGILAEYSGRNLAMFYIADAVKMLVVATLIIVLFFPYGMGHMAARFDITLPYRAMLVGNILLYLLKLFVVLFIAVIFVRVAAARLKIDQIAHVYFILLTMLSLGGLALIVLDTIIPIV